MTPIAVILEAGCQATGITLRELRGGRRFRAFVMRRKFIAKKLAAEGYGPSAIARAFGGLDHATIIHYLKT